MPLQPGTLLKQRYRIEGILGQGGMGAVYHAFDVNLGVSVALKENLFTTEEYARQFRREATILASLRHPNLPRVTDHFVIESEGQYLVMDFIQGVDLRERLERSGAVSEPECIPWFLEICDALAYLHSRTPSILHRDIKPGNIKIMPDGRAILVDFGLAKVVDQSGTTTTGAKAMTPGFSPPEQYGTGRTDPRTDVYSLGATMYAALTAAIPEDSLERAMGRERLTSIRKRNPNVSPSIARVIEKALGVLPEDRFQSINAMARALSAANESSKPALNRTYPYLDPQVVNGARYNSMGSIPTRTRPLTSAYARPRRWPMALFLVLAGGIMFAGASLAVPDLGDRVEAMLASMRTPQVEEASPTQESAASDTPMPSPTPTESAVVDLVNTPSPSADIVVNATPSEDVPPVISGDPTATPVGGGLGQVAFVSNQTGKPQVYLINLDGTGEVQLTNLPEGACQPAWTPDGTQLIFTSPCSSSRDTYQGSSLWLIDVDADGATSDPLQLPTAPGGDFDPAISPDGQRVAFTSVRGNRKHIWVMDLDGSDLLRLSREIAWDSEPAWSPTGDQLAFSTTRGGVVEVWIMSDVGGDDTRFSRAAGLFEDSHPDWSQDGKTIIFERNVGGVPRIFMSLFEDRGTIAQPVCPEGQRSVQPMAEPDLSPDGFWIVFETWPDGSNHNIAIMNISCLGFTELTTSSAYDFDPAWRPVQ
ncbi:MAG: protein kinase [Anaerolineales bacterium]|jgi:serine/threonine protein kinase